MRLVLRMRVIADSTMRQLAEELLQLFAPTQQSWVSESLPTPADGSFCPLGHSKTLIDTIGRLILELTLRAALQIRRVS